MGGRFTRNRKGQSIVEFALVVPMLIMLVFGIAEFGRAWMVKNILTGAAREAVRVAIVQTDLTSANTAASARAQNVLNSANIPMCPWNTPDCGLGFPDGNTAMVPIKYDFPRNRSERFSGPWQLDHAYPFLVDEKRIATLNHFLGDPVA